MSITIKQDIIPKGYRNRPGYANTMTYVTIHETGNTSKGANAKAHAAYLKGSGVNVPVSWHYTVDESEIYQSLPDNESGYHTGDGSKGQNTKTGISGGGALNSIGIEICVNSDGNFSKAVDRAAQLTAQLCKTHKISISHVVQHNYWKSSAYPSGKNCPQNLRAGKNGGWSGFTASVQKYMSDDATPAPEPTPAPTPSTNRPTLRKGDSGSDVKDMQTLLTQKAFCMPKYGIDGSFGSETERSVKNFQKVNDLAVDGVCGPKTWAALEG